MTTSWAPSAARARSGQVVRSPVAVPTAVSIWACNSSSARTSRRITRTTRKSVSGSCAASIFVSTDFPAPGCPSTTIGAVQAAGDVRAATRYADRSSRSGAGAHQSSSAGRAPVRTPRTRKSGSTYPDSSVGRTTPGASPSLRIGRSSIARYARDRARTVAAGAADDDIERSSARTSDSAYRTCARVA